MKIGNSPELNAYTKVSSTRTGGADAGRATPTTSTGTSNSTSNTAAATDASSSGATRATGVAAQDAASQVALSSTASSLMSSTAGTDDSVDMDKVNRIAAAIRNGEFSINAGVIADKLIANTAELLGKVQSH
ncbi:flagellar biosynthesis anti-sigma factor FlgM [Roseateles sp. SL47]|uniref:flagellar biosynthesis anti-sigma factor FlgM n=1 Tax=Roseateles sp. SL47 TaxID=2995138 RepID=UPI00226DE5A4|nr:flagellar biosynthesis anti-sigma factor FlgM [Roseateles sp. SL47]WAC72498.1 flagellar biosynthesis anti-sigma factor FlgM [Roseateles sp. SL47]